MDVTWRSGNMAHVLFASFLAALLLGIGTFRSSIYSALPYSPSLFPPSLSWSLAVNASISSSASSPLESSFTPPQSSAAPSFNAKTCPPPSTPLSISSCPKAICVASTSPGAGLGHRLTEYLQGIILSQTFSVDIATPEFEHLGNHGGYGGANQLFYPPNPGWNVPRCSIPPRVAGGTFTTEPGWTSALTLGLDKQFNQDMELMNALPYGLNGANSSDPTCVEMERMRAIVRDAPCNTVFPCTSFWPTTYEAAYGFFRDSYHGGANGTAVGKELHRLALVDKDRFNIAIHVRDGDQVPTEISYFPKVARKLLAVLEPLRIGVTVAIFSENPEHVLPTIVAVISDDFPGSDFKVVAHGEELNFLVAFGTFMAADVFVASVSSMSLIATFLAGDSLKPVVVAAPHVSGAENWAAGTLRADEEGNFEGGDVLEKVAREWMEERTKREGGQGRALGGASSLGHL